MLDTDFYRIANPEYIGIDGKPVERTPDEYPYSYDTFFVYKAAEIGDLGEGVYSDRMKIWDENKYKEATTAVWPEKPDRQFFYHCTPREIQKFLCLYLEKEVTLTAVLEGCNRYSGYHYWLFCYKEKGEKK